MSSLTSLFYNNVELKLTVVIFFQSEPEKQIENQVSEEKLYNVLDVELVFFILSDFPKEISQRVRF